jgi:hypothetical protein
MKILNALILIVSSISICSACYATTNTLTLVNSYPTQGGKICVYSDGHRTETYKKEGAGNCPSKKIFN